jgi:1-acyl-sn-glycerol-3-phosphate acyltransferase
MSAFRSYFIISPFFLISTIVFGTISMVVSLFDATGFRQHRVAVEWAKSLLWIVGVQVETSGIEKLVAGQGCVLACNHTSYMDTPVLLSYLPLQFRFFAKSGLFKVPFMGSHLRRAGHLPVVLDDARAGIRSMAEGAKLIREKNLAVLIFPEGGRSLDTLEDFKQGAAFVAIKAGVPVYPMAVTGVRQVLKMHASVFRRGRVRLQIGDPIVTSGMTLRDRAALTARLMQEIANMAGEPLPGHGDAASVRAG